MTRTLSALALLTIAAPVASGAALASDETLRTFEACVKRVRSLPRVAENEDVSWPELEREYRPRADAAESGAELRAVLNEMIAEVGISHTAVLDRATYSAMQREIWGRPTPTYGVLLEEMEPGRLFVRSMYDGGPGADARLRLGDEILEVDGEPPFESAEVVDAGYDPKPGSNRLYSFHPRDEGTEVELRVRSREREKTRLVTLVSEATCGLEAGRRSVRVVRREGTRIGVVHLWMIARGTADLLQDALKGELANCDALVIDLRGRGGLADEIGSILAPFRTGSSGRRRSTSRSSSLVTWRKPVVFLVDDRTRSAKEIIAWYVRDERLGPLVGEKTEGAVLGAMFAPLPGGNWLEMGAVEVPVGDGISLEGVGVAPTHRVRGIRPFANGVDPILGKGLELAAAAAAAASARRATIRGPY